jgi:tripartite-type tricarboxylate transporter receptor subunit TctC
MIRRRKLLAGAAGLTIVAPQALRAQSGQTIRIIVPYIPGGATDVAARIVADKLAPILGQQVIVENKAGGNTIVGMDIVAKAKPDGTTLLLATTTLATNAALGLKQPYDPLKDFAPISTIVDIPIFAAMNVDLPVKNYAQFAEWVNKQPQRVRYATSGVGNMPHLWAEQFRTQAKLNLENIAYKGAAESTRDVMGGHVPCLVDVILPTATYVKAGKMTGLLIAAQQRSPIVPDVPTVGEIGHKGLEAAVFYGLVAPAGTPRPIIDKLNQAVAQIIKDPETSKKFVDLGYIITGSTPEDYHALLVKETERWTRVVKENGIKIES